MLGRVRPRRFRVLSIPKLIPNALTVLALCAGLTAIRFALEERWELAVAAIVVAGVLDALDGTMARLLKAQSKFGAELDSLSDFLAFGVAPAMVVFLWSTVDAGRLGWAATLFFPVCCALRLARFNTKLDEDTPPYARGYFTGVPAPAGAGLALLPMMLFFQTEAAAFRHHAVIVPWLAAVGLLMVSTVPTFSLKRVRIPGGLVLPAFVGFAVLTAGLLSAPWTTLVAVGIVYLGSLPLAWLAFRRARRDHETAHAPPPVEQPG